MQKGISDFSHYPEKCGNRLAGVRSQTELMQSSPHRRGEGEEEKWKKMKKERWREHGYQTDSYYEPEYIAERHIGVRKKRDMKRKKKLWTDRVRQGDVSVTADWNDIDPSLLHCLQETESKRNTRTWRHTVKKVERVTEREER